MKYEPEIYTFNNGEPVKTVEEWKERRKEIYKLFSEEQYGYFPSDELKVSYEKTRSEDLKETGGTWETVKVTFETKKGKYEFPVNLFLADSLKKTPVIVWIHYGKTEPENYDLPYFFEAGFSLAVFNYAEVSKDSDDFEFGIAGLFDRDKYGSGKIGLWALAARKIVDYLVIHPAIDSKNIAVAGHSRLGKTALWAGATDERFRFVIPNNSGCSGMHIDRLSAEEKEHIPVIMTKFPFWYCENALKYQDASLIPPFDQHQLVALVAPRYLLVGDASEDPWADYVAEEHSLKASSKAWEYYGETGYSNEGFCKVGGMHEAGNVSFHIREGGHDMNRYDWDIYLAFMKKHLA